MNPCPHCMRSYGHAAGCPDATLDDIELDDDRKEEERDRDDYTYTQDWDDTTDADPGL